MRCGVRLLARTAVARQRAGVRPPCGCAAVASAPRRALASSSEPDDTDDLLKLTGGRTPGMRGRTLGGGRFTGATEGPASRRRTRPSGRTGLGGRISDGSILSDEPPVAAAAAAEPLVAGSWTIGMPIPSADQIPSGSAVARMSTARCKAGRLDDVVRYYDLRIGPAYGTCDGFKSAFLLVDRPANTVRSLSFWGSNEALLASIADEQYQKVAKGLLQLVDPNTMEAHTFEVGAAVGSEG